VADQRVAPGTGDALEVAVRSTAVESDITFATRGHKRRKYKAALDVITRRNMRVVVNRGLFSAKKFIEKDEEKVSAAIQKSYRETVKQELGWGDAQFDFLRKIISDKRSACAGNMKKVFKGETDGVSVRGWLRFLNFLLLFRKGKER
jgi:ribosomal protein L7/L12